MKRIVFIAFSLLFIVSCGSKKKVVTAETPSKEPKTVVTKLPEVVKDTVTQTPVEDTVREIEDVVEVPTAEGNSVVSKYINRYSLISVKEMHKYKIPASITLAQGILESNNGASRLATLANNHFGIKCHKSWKGESISHDDDARNECFRKYPNPEQSFRDHSLFLKNRKRYRGLFQLDRYDYKGWAYGLKRAGYATDPKYPKKLISLIERYKLYNYDNVLPQDLSDEVANDYENITVDGLSNQAQTSSNFYRVQAGDTLYSIARNNNTTVQKLKEINNLSSNLIKVGQQLQLN